MNEKFKKGHIGIVEKAQETSSDSDMQYCVLAVLHEQWMCLGIQRNTHITGNNLIPISVPIHFVDGSYMYIYTVYRCPQFRSLANCYYL